MKNHKLCIGKHIEIRVIKNMFGIGIAGERYSACDDDYDLGSKIAYHIKVFLGPIILTYTS